MRLKSLTASLLAAGMLMLPASAIGSGPSTQLEPIGPVKRGEAFVIRGVTQLPEVMIRIQRPNGTTLELDQLTGSGLAAGKTVTLPADASEGTYTVLAGTGADVASVTFTASAGGGGSPGAETPGGGGSPGAETPGGGGSPGAETPGGGSGPVATAQPQAGRVVVQPGAPDGSGQARASIGRAALEQAAAQTQGAPVTVEVAQTAGAGAYILELPAAVLDGGAASRSIRVQTEFATLTLPSRMLEGAGASSTASIVSLKIARPDTAAWTEAVRQKTGTRPAVNLSISLDGRETPWQNSRAPVQVTIPYVPSQEERIAPDFIVVWYIDGSGRPAPVSSSRYDAAAGGVTFQAAHFSEYAVVYDHPVYPDTGSYSWAKPSIEALSARGIIQGLPDGRFSPEEHITRADFVLMLMRTLGLQASAASNSFEDVHPEDYYFEALASAKALGITDGADASKFLPGREITRQDMLTLTHRALKAAGIAIPAGSTAELDAFPDRSSIAGYAAESTAALVKNGIVEGDGAGIHPLNRTTRAETAVIMYRLYRLAASQY